MLASDRQKAAFSSCDDGLCLNGAECVQFAAQRYRCVCAEGYQGVYCHLGESTQFHAFSTASAIFLIGLFLLIMLSALLICQSSNIGCYLVMPGERNYTRWDEDDEHEDDRIPLEILESEGIKTSATADTIVDVEGCSQQMTRDATAL
uniref:EGF-like domain-containing protein n=1 Tax=Parascaris univalens TaxID=6257 RepID=A0A915BGW1_PARUN